MINNLLNDFSKIVAVEKYPDLSKFILKNEKIKLFNSDILVYEDDQKFDLITIFGVMNFFNSKEAIKIYKKCFNWIKPDGKILIKHQMGIKEDVIVDGYSQELKTNYYSEYRWIDNEIKILKDCGLLINDIVDIYPDDFNRWENTKFIALICSPHNMP